MNLSTALEAIGFRRTIAPGRSPGDVQHGEFNSNAPLRGRGPDELAARYGLKITPTAGTFDGEAKPDPSVIAQWQRSRHLLGGADFLESAVKTAFLTAEDVRDLERPDDTTNTDIMLISRDGRTTAYQELILPWLKATNGGQDDSPGDAASHLEPRIRSLEERVALLEQERA